MLKPRACWSVLLTKAEDEVDRIQGELQQIRLRAQSLEASRERLHNLHADCHRVRHRRPARRFVGAVVRFIRYRGGGTRGPEGVRFLLPPGPGDREIRRLRRAQGGRQGPAGNR